MTVATRALFTGAIPPLAAGTWAPTGSRAVVDEGAGYKAFPGLARLDAARLVTTYYHGTTHQTDGIIKGRIGTLSGYAPSWGSEFTIKDHAEDVRHDSQTSIVDGKVIVPCRLFDGSANHDPFLMVSDDPASSFTASTTWTQRDIAFAVGSTENLTSGRLLKVGNTYALGAIAISGSTWTAGVLRNGSLDDWSSPTWVPIGSDGQMSEITTERLSGASVLALIRRQTGTSTYYATSNDAGATWTTPASAHDGFGLPAFRRMTDGTLLTVYRDAPDGDTAWRQGSSGSSWGAESILDSEGTRNVYGAIQQLDHGNALVIYSLERSSGDADIYTRLFTRS